MSTASAAMSRYQAPAPPPLAELVQVAVRRHQVEDVDGIRRDVPVPGPRAAARQHRHTLALDPGEKAAEHGDPVQKLEADLAQERSRQNALARADRARD